MAEVSTEVTLQPDFFDGYVAVSGFVADKESRRMLRREYELLYETEMRLRE